MTARHEIEWDSTGEPRRRYTAETPPELRECLHHINATAQQYMGKGQPILIGVRTASAMSWRTQKRLNAMCGDMAKQADWYGNKLTKDEWRHLVVAVLRNDQRQLPGDRLEVRIVDRSAIAHAAVVVDIAAAQQLIDDLWRAGLRPTEGTGSAGALAATERHLNDMRDIVHASLAQLGMKL